MIPGIIIDLVILPRILSFIALWRNRKSALRRKVNYFIRVTTMGVLILSLVIGISIEAYQVSKNELVYNLMASPLMSIFAFELILVIIIDTYLTAAAYGYYWKLLKAMNTE